MARFLSDEWFEEVERDAGESPTGRGGRPLEQVAELIVEQVVTGAPDGEVRYRVVAGPGGPVVTRGGGTCPDLVLTTDYLTAAAIAQGQLSAATAVGQGRVKVSGSLRKRPGPAAALAGAQLVAAAVRDRTTY
jgi:hypothetical protein